MVSSLSAWALCAGARGSQGAGGGGGGGGDSGGGGLGCWAASTSAVACAICCSASIRACASSESCRKRRSLHRASSGSSMLNEARALGTGRRIRASCVLAAQSHLAFICLRCCSGSVLKGSRGNCRASAGKAAAAASLLLRPTLAAATCRSTGFKINQLELRWRPQTVWGTGSSCGMSGACRVPAPSLGRWRRCQRIAPTWTTIKHTSAAQTRGTQGAGAAIQPRCRRLVLRLAGA